MTPGLRVSIGANITLLGVVAVLLWRGPPGVSSSVTPATASSPSEQPAATDADAVTREPPSESFEPKVTRAAIAGLEEMGIPRDVLVNALLGDFHRRWDMRFAALEKRYAPKRVPERDYIELGRLRDAEQVRELKEALGEEGYLAWDRERTLGMLNMGGIRLTPEEAERAYRLQKVYDEQYKELQMAMEDGVADVADMRALGDQAREALDRELENLLGRQRYDAMRGAQDPIAEVYRIYGDLSPTPVQAEAVLQAEGAYRDREAALARGLTESAGEAPDLAAGLSALNEAREEELRKIFGAAAYDDMKRQSDSTYQRIEQFADAWELQDQEILPVYESLRTFHDQAQFMRAAAAMRESAGESVDWREVNAAIEQVRQHTELGLQNLIGAKRLWRLKQDGILTMR